MTITICVATPDGIVMGADSRMTYTNPRGWPKIATDSAEKLFEFGRGGAICTAGWAIVNGRTISSHVNQLKQQSALAESPQAAAELLGTYFDEQIKQHVEAELDEPPDPGDALHFHVSGFDSQGVGRVFRVRLPEAEVTEVMTTEPEQCGAATLGQVDVFTRLMRGIDPRIDLSFLDETSLKKMVEAVEGISYRTTFPLMTLQDAVDYAIFVMRMTIEMQRFSDGVNAAPGEISGTGGPLDVLVISRSMGRQWVHRKTLRGQSDGAPSRGPMPVISFPPDESGDDAD